MILTKYIAILGAGSIGQLLAHKLTDASVDCQLIVRDIDNYSQSKWILHSNEADIEHKLLLSQIDATDRITTLFICVKAPQLESALESIKHRLDHNSQLVFFQNGMGHERLAHRYVEAEQIFFASNTHGAYRAISDNQQKIFFAGKGAIDFGSYANLSQPEWFHDRLQQALAAKWSDDIENVLWRKLLVNAVINPLTAIHQCKNGQLLDEDKKLSLLSLIEENKQFAQSIHLPFADQLKDIVLSVIEKTANNYSSMFQDTQANKITEINAINGFLLDKMQANSFHAPHNWNLWSKFHIQFPPLKQIALAKAQTFDELQYYVTQQKGTERPFTGQYYQHQEQGSYLCVCCDNLLFTEEEKFDSGCGWPSFDRARNHKAIAYKMDYSHNMQRIEILCAQCSAHLGHVFDDGPTDTGQRFCVNSVSLNFKKH
ncbi:MAG: peptide-methionine (R)-S-oxide reductase MsrB [Kangiellaceae bacterium]|nr:peptide-methionine (R)-S-oxide reductase MsrB [Kangiellaceae bacterium]